MNWSFIDWKEGIFSGKLKENQCDDCLTSQRPFNAILEANPLRWTEQKDEMSHRTRDGLNGAKRKQNGWEETEINRLLSLRLLMIFSPSFFYVFFLAFFNFFSFRFFLLDFFDIPQFLLLVNLIQQWARRNINYIFDSFGKVFNS